MFVESDIESQLEDADNGVYSDEKESNEYKNKDEQGSDLLVLNTEIDFGTWELAKLYLNNYAKQEEFSFCKKRCTTDTKDNTKK
ncbi:17182_t:CDS:2 [Dentiscutata erythropus]|uniref:17182_t:CDS:1 n=1 Tax=Dentiscutata erythropus TaxID=1348616 RepID=A0A9N9P299_9GLOM|nr:17182_t:CDS:2 [Dentiscutata erythropus]